MLKNISPLLRLRISEAAKRSRYFHSSAGNSVENRVYNSIRHEDEFSSLLLLSASSNAPLIILWTASWCPSCKVVAPMLKDLIERERVGEREGGLHYAEVEIDSPTIGDLAMRYTITSLPTLLSFSRQEAQMETRTTALNDLKRPDFLREWLENEARRGGAGGAGGASLFGLFGR